MKHSSTNSSPISSQKSITTFLVVLVAVMALSITLPRAVAALDQPAIIEKQATGLDLIVSNPSPGNLSQGGTFSLQSGIAPTGGGNLSGGTFEANSYNQVRPPQGVSLWVIR